LDPGGKGLIKSRREGRRRGSRRRSRRGEIKGSYTFGGGERGGFKNRF
tara:strand:- start:25 stop:168 length:144 start_codon:yes stop_codon:yes gene_type:complete